MSLVAAQTAVRAAESAVRDLDRDAAAVVFEVGMSTISTQTTTTTTHATTRDVQVAQRRLASEQASAFKVCVCVCVCVCVYVCVCVCVCVLCTL
jgi:hypothetical protein